jgi:putative PIN family toxin of toxin-antitoxin system
MNRVVLDTDVLVAGLRSPAGASAEVLRLAQAGRVRLVASVALVLEYEAVATRPEQLCAIGRSRSQVLAVLTDIAAIADEVQSHFNWRPQLHDPDDELVLEAAINGRARYLVSFNRRDFGDAPERFGVKLCTPGDFLRSLRA